MLIYLIIYVIIMFLISYYTLGQDVFQPSCIVNASYVVSTLCAYIDKDIWNVQYHYYTFIVIASGLIVFYLTNLFIYIGSNKFVFQKRDNLDMHLINVNMAIFSVVIIGQLVSLLVYYKEVIRITGGGSSFYAMMNTFRMTVGYGDDYVSGAAGELEKFSFVCAEVFLFIFINNKIFDKQKRNKRYLLPAGIFIVQALLTGGRFDILIMVFTSMIMYNITWHRKYGWNRTITFKTISRIVLVVCVIFAAFYLGRALVGRQSDSDIVTYISSYAGGSIPLLDMYLQDPPAHSDLLGKETFYTLLKNLKQIGLISFPDYIVHLEFRSSNGFVIGNVYTAFRRQIQDFGFSGMIILQMIWSGIVSFWYKSMRYHPSDINIIFYTMMAYPVFFHSVNDYFYMNNVSIGYLITLALTYVIYKITARNEIINTEGENASE